MLLAGDHEWEQLRTPGARCRGDAFSHVLPVFEHIVDPAADRLLRPHPEHPRRGGVEQAHDLLVIDEDDAVVDELECLGRAGALVRLCVEQRVVERDRRPSADLDREREVVIRERRLRRHGAERDRSEGAAARREGDHDP